MLDFRGVIFLVVFYTRQVPMAGSPKNDGFPSSESLIPFGAILRWTMLNFGRLLKTE